jgi:hypothetical protein
VSIDQELVEAVAQRTAELVLEQLDERNMTRIHRLVTAAELAPVLGISRDAVYANAERLGAVRIGDGPRSRLRFDVDRAIAAQQHTGDKPEPARPARQHRPRANGSAELLPIRGVGRRAA